MLKASIDMGSNSFLLTIANVEDGKVIDVLEDQLRLVRLGQGVDQNKRLHPDAKERAFQALDDFVSICQTYEITPSSVHAVGTSALRDAEDSSMFVEEVRERTGFILRVIPGTEEAWWSYTGALSSLPLVEDAKPCLVDIGGGSTEIVWSNGDICHSIDVGVVRARERFLCANPPTRSEVRQLKEAVLVELQSLPNLPNPEPLIAVAGTPTTLVAMQKQLTAYDGSLVHGEWLTQNRLRSQLESLCSLPLEERKQLAGLHPKRADLIIGGAVILLVLMEQMNQERLIVSDRGLRFGLLVGSRVFA